MSYLLGIELYNDDKRTEYLSYLVEKKSSKHVT